MTSTRRRCPWVLAAGLAALVLLTGCDPVAWMRRQPSDPSPTVGGSASISSGPSRTVVDASCASDQGGTGAAVTEPSGAFRAYSSLPSGGFTDAVAAATGQVVVLPRSGIGLRDFTPAGGTIDGGVLGPAAIGMTGSGAATTTVEVTPHSSTRADDVPTTFPMTNQLSVLRVTGHARLLSGFAVRGTPQGHLYNGLRIDAVRDLRASDLLVAGIPGDDGKPPGETFGINDYRTVGSEYARVEVDGEGVGGSGFATNGSRDVRICDTSSHDNRFGMGFAFWQSSGLRLVDCSADDNGFAGFNFERVSGDNVLIRPQASGNRFGMRIASDRGSARFTIVDPQLTDGTWTVTLPKRFYGTANRQRRDDITLIVDGRRRPDLLRFQTY